MDERPSRANIARGGNDVAGMRSELELAAKRSANALDVSSSIVSALIRNPGPMGSKESVVAAARTMLRAADEATQVLVGRLGLQSIPWAEYRIMKSVTQAVSDTWRSTSEQSLPSADVSALIPVWEAICSGIDIPEPRPDVVDEKILLQVALLDSMQLVVREISSFALFHDEKKAATHARNRILSAARQSCRALQGGRQPTAGHDQLMAALLRNAGTIYASAWRKQAENVKNVLSEMSEPSRIGMAGRYPDGFPLDIVDRGFVESFQKLAELAQVLSPPARRTRPELQAKEVNENQSSGQAR